MASTTTIETRTVTALAAHKRIKKCFKLKRPVFLWGPPGIGKSDLVQGITDEMGGHMIDMRMALMAPDEIRGIPFYNKEKGVKIDVKDDKAGTT
jgi:MoxR-like ATPase